MEVSIEDKKKYIISKLRILTNSKIDMNIDKLYNAIKTETSFEIESDNEYIWLGHYYWQIVKDYDQMKKYYCMAIKKGDLSTMTNLGLYYETIEKDYDQMKKYYLMAIDRGNVHAMHNLGVYYEKKEKDYDQMKKYYLMAIEKGDIDAIISLGSYYEHVEQDYNQMKKYYLMAIEKGDSRAMTNLGLYYKDNDTKLHLLIKNSNKLNKENEQLKYEIELLKLRPGSELYNYNKRKFEEMDF